MIKTTVILLQELAHTCRWPAHKLGRMVKRGEVRPIVRGLYETDPHTPGHLLAESIYGPSYLSFVYVLSLHELIPEGVFVFTSATFKKKKEKYYRTPFGNFSCRDIPPDAFPCEVRMEHEGEYWYKIASPEKALCDQLYKVPPLRSQKELEFMLFEDLRIDEDGFARLNFAVLSELAERYHATNLKLLKKFIRRRGNEVR